MSESAPLFRHPFAWLRNKFLAGLALVIPMLVTFWILKIIHDFLHELSTPLLLPAVHFFEPSVTVNDPGFQDFTSFVGFLIPVVVLVALGVVATNVIGARMVVMMDRLVLRIPMISFIYKSLKQVMDAFKGFGGNKSFKRVVYVQYPSEGMRLIGFVTGQFFDSKLNQAMTCVFLPTAPSPMTGFVIVADSNKVTDAPLTMEEAMKMIFSGGLIGPGPAKPPSENVARTPTLRGPVPQGLQSDFGHLPKAEDHHDESAGTEAGARHAAGNDG